MRLHPDDAALLRECEERAIAESRQGSHIDHASARFTLRELLVEYERIGHSWPQAVLDEATEEGLGKRIKARVKSKRIAVVNSTGSVTNMPVAYSDGKQLSIWLFMSLEEIDDLIASIDSQAQVLGGRIEILVFVRSLIAKHGVDNGIEALRAEGLDPAAFALPGTAA